MFFDTPDRILSMTFGRPPMIPSHYVRFVTCVDEQLDVMGPDEGSAPTNMSSDNNTACFFVATA